MCVVGSEAGCSQPWLPSKLRFQNVMCQAACKEINCYTESVVPALRRFCTSDFTNRIIFYVLMR